MKRKRIAQPPSPAQGHNGARDQGTDGTFSSLCFWGSLGDYYHKSCLVFALVAHAHQKKNDQCAKNPHSCFYMLFFSQKTLFMVSKHVH